MRRVAAFRIATCVLLGVPSSALSAFGLAEVRAGDGRVLARAGAGSFLHPASGSGLAVGGARLAVGPLRAVLTDVSVLSGRIRAVRVVVPATGLRGARVDGLTVDGRSVAVRPNTVISLGAGGYLVALQQAVAPGAGGSRTGVVGLRVHVGRGVAGVPAGAEIWVGLAAGARRTGSVAIGAASRIPPRLVPLYRRAAARYNVPWEVLAAINRYETGFGSNLAVSSAGALGWMQFMPGTWRAYGVDGNGDGKADPWHPEDAIPAAARYLAAAGAASDLARAVFSYNHSSAYVAMVLAEAARYATSPTLAGAGPLDPAQLGGARCRRPATC